MLLGLTQTLAEPYQRPSREVGVVIHERLDDVWVDGKRLRRADSLDAGGPGFVVDHTDLTEVVVDTQGAAHGLTAGNA